MRLQIPSSEEEKKRLRREAEFQAKQSHLRPSYHFRTTGGWMNDPNGTILFNSTYHMFYQSFPYSIQNGQVHWGHAKSKDLIHWEHLPDAILPSINKGEIECWSGCCVDFHGVPTIYYTSIGSKWPKVYDASQWAAISDEEMLNWKKIDTNPAMSMKIHEKSGLMVEDWRDPYLFEHKGEWYAVLGGHVTTKTPNGDEYENPSAFLYSSQDLRTWTFLGSMTSGYPSPGISHRTSKPKNMGGSSVGWNWECPNFFMLDKSKELYCLIVSPHDRLCYTLGTFDGKKFDHGEWYTLDHSSIFYASNTFRQLDDTLIIIAWVRGRGGHNDGIIACMSLPRALRPLPNGKLSIQPYKGIEQLRKESIFFPDFEVETDRQVNISDLAECTMFFRQSERRLEIIYDIDLVPRETPTEGGFSISLFHEEDVDGGQFETEIGMNYEENLVYHGKEHGFIDLKNIKTFHIHQFMDNSVIETFIGDSDVITTRLYPRPNASPQISFKTMDFGIKVKNLRIWRLRPIWD